VPYSAGTTAKVAWGLANGSTSEFQAKIKSRAAKRPRRERTPCSEYKYLLQWKDGGPALWSRLLHRDHTVLNQAASSTCLLVRSHNPTEKAIARVIGWANDLQEMQPPVTMWWSLDVSNGDSAVLRIKQQIAEHDKGSKKSCQIRIHTYTQADMLALYPKLNDMLTRMAPLWKRLVGKVS
jgi:hypothetical protein